MKPEDTSITPAPPPAPGFSSPRQELRVVAAYLILATIWVVSSDRLLEWVTQDARDSTPMQTFKGVNFVFTTAVLL